MPITIHLSGRKEPLVCDSGICVREIMPARDSRGYPVVAALVNNDVASLQTRLAMNCTVRPLSVASQNGWLVFRRTMCFLLSVAAKRALPGCCFRVRHSIGCGVYATLRDAQDAPERPVTNEEVARLRTALSALVAEDLPIRQELCGYEETVETFAKAGRHDKVGLLQHMNAPVVLLQTCGEDREIYQGAMLASTGQLTPLEILREGDGILAIGPSRHDPFTVAPHSVNESLMRIHREHAIWGDILGIHCVGDLNQAVADRCIGDVMQMSEALHDKKFSQIADLIASRKPMPRLVLIAGPSSAGKTTSCKRLGIHLRVNGLHPVMLSTDDYFVDEKDDPIGPDGKPDYEDIRAVDIDGLKSDIAALFEGKEIRRRQFDFRSKKPVWTEERIHLGPTDILCIEGIHGLNPLLTDSIPREKKFLIYLSAITQLGIDDTTILPTSDNRLIRRIVRDNLFRGHDAKKTISLWPNVRRGEEKWIFPYQNEADLSFNSSLDYELSVLRPYAEALLAEVKPCDAEYATARRLQDVLKNFHPIPPNGVPGNSILREYIGGSIFQY
ncbi:MAG: nucleoside kinase [Kiritimatiellia bacterium]